MTQITKRTEIQKITREDFEAMQPQRDSPLLIAEAITHFWAMAEKNISSGEQAARRLLLNLTTIGGPCDVSELRSFDEKNLARAFVLIKADRLLNVELSREQKEILEGWNQETFKPKAPL